MPFTGWGSNKAVFSAGMDHPNKGDDMAKNFRDCSREINKHPLALQLLGDFDATSACEPIDILVPPQRDPMNRVNEKRNNDLRVDDQIDTEVPIVCRPYTSNGNVRLAQGVMRNFSSRGFYVESNQKFKTGTILIVRMVGCLPAPSFMESDEKPWSICLGEIKWEQDLADAEQCLYGMGSG
jgi:hypothetical protein